MIFFQCFQLRRSCFLTQPTFCPLYQWKCERLPCSSDFSALSTLPQTFSLFPCFFRLLFAAVLQGGFEHCYFTLEMWKTASMCSSSCPWFVLEQEGAGAACVPLLCVEARARGSRVKCEAAWAEGLRAVRSFICSTCMLILMQLMGKC